MIIYRLNCISAKLSNLTHLPVVSPFINAQLKQDTWAELSLATSWPAIDLVFLEVIALTLIFPSFFALSLYYQSSNNN